MRGELSPRVVFAGVVGLALLALGIVYLSVECQALPGFMGPVHGDTSPRTGLGILAAALGVVALVGALVVGRRRGT
jgi:hypothetical protein